MAEQTTHQSPVITGLLSGAVAIIISAAVYIFTQGQLKSSLDEVTRRLTNIETGTVTRTDLADLERRVSSLESVGSPALGAMRSEITINAGRITKLEENIPKALNEAGIINTEQNVRITRIEARQEEGLRQLQILQTGMVPPLSDRLQVLTTNVAVLTQRIDALDADLKHLYGWKITHEDRDRDVMVNISRLEQIAKSCQLPPK